VAVGRKKPRFNKGVLENAGLSEVAHFLKKAKQQMEYAAFAIEHADLGEVADKVHMASEKIGLLVEGIEDIQNAIDEAERELLQEAEKAEAEQPED